MYELHEWSNVQMQLFTAGCQLKKCCNISEKKKILSSVPLEYLGKNISKQANSQCNTNINLL